MNKELLDKQLNAGEYLIWAVNRIKELEEVIDVVDLPDGSAELNMDMEPEQICAFAHTGLKYLIEQMRVHDKVSELSPNTFSEEVRTMELSDEALNALFHFGVIDALKRGIANEQNNKEEEDGREVSG